jgi:hypothetical protein
MSVQYEPVPFSGRTSLVPFGAVRREPDFTRTRTFRPAQATPPSGATFDGATLDVEALWRAIEAVPAPPIAAPSAAFHSTKARPSAAGAAVMMAIWRRRLLATGLSVGAGVGMALEPAAQIAWAAVAVGGAYFAASLPKRAAQVARTARQIEKQLTEGLHCWWDRCSSADFLEAKGQLEAARADLVLLAAEERHRLETCANERHTAQLKRHLQECAIGRDKIRGIGPRRLERLTAHGVANAHDVTASRVSRVPGIGPVTTQALLDWRAMMESEFVHDPQSNRLDRTRTAMIRNDIAQRGAALRAQLLDGPQRLTLLGAAIEAKRGFVESRLDELHERWLQAGADLKICGQRPSPLPAPPTRVSPTTIRVLNGDDIVEHIFDNPRPWTGTGGGQSSNEGAFGGSVRRPVFDRGVQSSVYESDSTTQEWRQAS